MRARAELARYRAGGRRAVENRPSCTPLCLSCPFTPFPPAKGVNSHLYEQRLSPEMLGMVDVSLHLDAPVREVDRMIANSELATYKFLLLLRQEE